MGPNQCCTYLIHPRGTARPLRQPVRRHLDQNDPPTYPLIVDNYATHKIPPPPRKEWRKKKELLIVRWNFVVDVAGRLERFEAK
jgi:hypothetical protein